MTSGSIEWAWLHIRSPWSWVLHSAIVTDFAMERLRPHAICYGTRWSFSSADRESAYVIDGLMHNDVVQSDIHSTDAFGYSSWH
jgi:hypothetical protein